MDGTSRVSQDGRTIWGVEEAPTELWVNLYAEPPHCGWYGDRATADKRAERTRTHVARYVLADVEPILGG
jgi:hypothetical protein